MLELLPQQKAVIREVMSGLTKLLYLVGSIRSGKSLVAVLCLMLMIDRLAKFRIKGQFILAGHSVESVRTNIVEPYLIPFMEARKWPFRDRGGSRPRIETRGSAILVYGGSDRRSENRMRGMSASGALVDEIAKVEPSFFFQVLERCSENQAKVIATTNKRGAYDWEKREIVDRIEELQGKIFSLKLEDNSFLDDRYVEWIQSALTGHYRQRDVLDLYAEATGLVYTDYQVIDEKDIPYDWTQQRKYVGVDWAQSGVTAGLCLTENPLRRGQFIVSDEYYESNEHSGLDHHGHATAMTMMWSGMIDIRCDPSAPYIHAAFRKLGQPVRFANNNVLEGLAAVHGAFFRRELIISSRCVHTLEEAASYAWREQTKGGVEEHPIKNNDHAMDGLRYIGVELFPSNVIAMPTPLGPTNAASRIL